MSYLESLMLVLEAFTLAVLMIIALVAVGGMVRTWLNARDEAKIRDVRRSEALTRAVRIVAHDESAEKTEHFLEAYGDVLDEDIRRQVEMHRDDRVIREHS